MDGTRDARDSTLAKKYQIASVSVTDTYATVGALVRAALGANLQSGPVLEFTIYGDGFDITMQDTYSSAEATIADGVEKRIPATDAFDNLKIKTAAPQTVVIELLIGG
jgi:hypothetical protein